MKVAIYPGSFDPITSGHLNIIERASKIFDRLIVCVMVNAGKHPMFTQQERVEMISSMFCSFISISSLDCIRNSFFKVRDYFLR